MIHALPRALKRQFKKENTNDDDIADVSTLRQFNFVAYKRNSRRNV